MWSGFGFLVLVLGCGDGKKASSSGDAAPDAGNDAAPVFEPTAPEEPALPSFVPCPAGWREVADEAGSFDTCDPWPTDGPSSCADDEAQFVGGTGCERIGTACPAGDFAEGLPASGVVYVKAGAAAGGDGSLGAPFATIAEGVAAADSGDVIALSKGTFEETVDVRIAITLRGACVAETIVTSDAPSATMAVLSFGGAGGGVLENLQVGGARPGVGIHGNRDPVRVESVLVRGASSLGITVYAGGEAEIDRVAVRDTQSDVSTHRWGYGVDVVQGSTATVTRAVLEGNRCSGVAAQDAGTVVSLEDVAVRGVLEEEASEDFGYGVSPALGARITIARSIVEGARSAALYVWGGASLEATDVVVRDTAARALDDALGIGLAINRGGRATLRRVVLERSHELGLRVQDPESSLVATDLVVRDTLPSEDRGLGGYGIEIYFGAPVTLERAALLRNRGIGLFLLDEGTNVEATDLLVLDTESVQADGTAGDGLGATTGAHLGLTRARIEGSRSAGVLLTEGGSLDATDLAVVGTRGAEVDGRFGIGLELDSGARATLLRAVLVGNRTAGLAAINEGTLSGEDVTVEGTLPAACEADGCAGAGSGAMVWEGGAITLTRFRVAGSALCGLQVSDRGELDLHTGEVLANPVGVNVSVADYDLARLQDEVRYVDNGVAFGSDDLPIPDVATLP